MARPASAGTLAAASKPSSGASERTQAYVPASEAPQNTQHADGASEQALACQPGSAPVAYSTPDQPSPDAEAKEKENASPPKRAEAPAKTKAKSGGSSGKHRAKFTPTE